MRWRRWRDCWGERPRRRGHGFCVEAGHRPSRRPRLPRGAETVARFYGKLPCRHATGASLNVELSMTARGGNLNLKPSGVDVAGLLDRPGGGYIHVGGDVLV